MENKLKLLRVIASGYHFPLCRDRYRAIRQINLGNISWPSINKFTSIMWTTNSKYLVNACKFIK